MRIPHRDDPADPDTEDFHTHVPDAGPQDLVVEISDGPPPFPFGFQPAARANLSPITNPCPSCGQEIRFIGWPATEEQAAWLDDHTPWTCDYCEDSGDADDLAEAEARRQHPTHRDTEDDPT